MLAHSSGPVDEQAVVDEAADEEALAEYEAKGGISHSAIMAWVQSWASERELPDPKIGD